MKNLNENKNKTKNLINIYIYMQIYYCTFVFIYQSVCYDPFVAPTPGFPCLVGL